MDKFMVQLYKVFLPRVFGEIYCWVIVYDKATENYYLMSKQDTSKGTLTICQDSGSLPQMLKMLALTIKGKEIHKGLIQYDL